jgi:ParB/RepB/Spo0J family partition protein
MTTATGAAPRAADSAGITGVPAVAPLGQLAAHPRNPRRDLGDLTEITASIAAHGVFEPLVVLTAEAFTAAAEADGDPERPVPGFTHVIVMGHRRAAAARAAGVEQVPVLVRDDLAGAAAIAAMIAENTHRQGLDPLAEAEAMAELARRGWRQRRIAAETGCSQAHVSKRMALLQLPGDARDALAAGTLSVADALELHKLAGAGDREVTDRVIDHAAGEITAGRLAPASAVSLARQEVRRALAEKQARAELAAAGIDVVTSAQRDRQGWPRVWDGDQGPHQEAGCLAAMIGWAGAPEYVCVNPAGHPDTEQGAYSARRAREAADERESRKAAKARDAACTAIAAGQLPAPGELARLLAATMLDGSGHSETLRLACRWLRDAGIAPPGADHYRWRDELAAAGDHAGLQRYAYAYALAADEVAARYRRDTWGPRQAAHLERLTARAGYQPGEWEQARAGEARQAAAARGTVACPDCGCTATAGPSGCDVRYDRDAGRPVQACAWNCPRHRAAREAATAAGQPGPGQDPDAVFDALADLFTATDPTTAAGSRLPAGLADAVQDARATFADLYEQLEGDQPPGAAVTAALALRGAARPFETDWTPELRDAFTALAALGTPAGKTAPGEHSGAIPGRRPGPAGQDGNALHDLLVGIIIAIDPTTAAGSRLPDAVADAIAGARSRFAAAYRDWQPGLDSTEVLATAHGLAAAAVPHADQWTPELDAALSALAASEDPEAVDAS